MLLLFYILTLLCNICPKVRDVETSYESSDDEQNIVFQNSQDQRLRSSMDDPVDMNSLAASKTPRRKRMILLLLAAIFKFMNMVESLKPVSNSWTYIMKTNVGKLDHYRS